ncbi:MAG: tyrosine-type recombinase/integrase [Propionibacterium sp.]|nr:tyrosine-type recombinase/integrase [Propionibacterium sp.]
MADQKHLLRRRQGWYAVVEVPPSLRATLGRRLKRTLKTRDLAVARARRWSVLADLKATIEQARKAPSGDPLTSEALAYREALDDARRRAEATPYRGDPDDLQALGAFHDSLPDTLLADAIADRAGAIEATQGTDAAVAFADLALGRTTPLDLHVDAWVSEGGPKSATLRPRTRLERRRAVASLASWLAAQGLPVTVEAITRKVAGRYVSHLLASGRERRTLAKRVRSLHAYWSWLLRRGHLDEDLANPWQDQVPAVPAHQPTEHERAFTDDEVARLLASPPDVTLADFMKLAALTGMRREEIAQLTVADCTEGAFIIRQGKTAAARRRVPIHSDLAPLVARRTAHKAPTDYLFEDLASSTHDRSDPLGKRFTRYRRSLGIQEGAGRRSLVNLHSFRRWFVTKAINAGCPPHVVSLLVGHSEGRKGMTLGPYWSGAEDDALRAVVEAVKLPEPFTAA